MLHSLKDKLIHLSKIRIRFEMPEEKQGLEKKADDFLQKGRKMLATLSQDERFTRRAEQLRATSKRLSEKSKIALAQAKKCGMAEMARFKNGTQKQPPSPK